ncbi:MAG: acylneuraminate cytidylyltransferase family protein [Chlorobi bacterium]|nr:acylneuraminate cytidylyltransferase family protein [Chlorobiota bacterium]
MIKSNDILAIIPARSGSQRLQNKNILPIAGKPMIVYTIEQALLSRHLEEVFVSTDDQEVADIAIRYGANVPFIRPKELSSNDATIFDVVKHAVEYLKNSGRFFKYVLLLQPTSPLRESTHIDESIDLLEERNADGIISVCNIDHPLQWVNNLPENKSMVGFLRHDLKSRRSQDYEKLYRLNGAIYIAKVGPLLHNNSFFLESNIYAYVMDRLTSIDVDTDEDLLLASLLIEKRLSA